MTAGLSTLRPASATLNRIGGAPYFLDHDVIRNQFSIRVLNKRNTPAVFHLQFIHPPAGLIGIGADSDLVVPALGETMRPLVLTLPRASFTAEFPVVLRLVSAEGRTVLERTLPFVGPGR